MQLEVLVSGQEMLSDDTNNFIEVLKDISETMTNGIKLIKEKLEIHRDLLPTSYVTYMGQLALKNELEYTDDEKKIVFHMNKDDYIFTLNGTMKLYNSIEKIGGDFTKEVKMSDTKDAVQTAFNKLKMNLVNLK